MKPWLTQMLEGDRDLRARIRAATKEARSHRALTNAEVVERLHPFISKEAKRRMTR